MLCAIAKVSRSGYYVWQYAERTRTAHEEQDRELAGLIEVVCGRRLGKLGYRQVTMKLATHGQVVNHKRVARVMQEYDLQAKVRRKNPYKQIMQKTQEHRTCPNLLDRKFDQAVPYCVAGTDITYVWVPLLKRFVYLSVIKDMATGEILAFVVSQNLTMPLATETVRLLYDRLQDNGCTGFMLHSDQGVHYTHPAYQSLLREYGIVQSMSRKGNCIDNAPTESFFGHMKDELTVAHCTTFREVQIAIAAYVSYHNEQRCQWERKKMAPVEYRNHLLVLLATT